MEGGVDVACAVHYVQADSGIRYRVSPIGTPLKVPSDTTLSDYAESERWAVAEEDSMRVPGSGLKWKTGFWVHVGPWPTEPGRRDNQMHKDKLTETSWLRGHHLKRQTKREQRTDGTEGPSTITEVVDERLKQVPEPTQIDAPEGLAPILESGQFRVTGNVYFAPLQPFQSVPDIPAGREEARNNFVAFQSIGERREVGFRYPEDVR